MAEPTPLLSGATIPGNSFVLLDHKLVYIPVTKAACTSLRWMIADLAGEDFASFYRSPAAHQSRLMTIHTDRRTWRHAPPIGKVGLADRADISRDNGWLIFTVVRDPWSRLWSAWQSKFLVRQTRYGRLYGDQPWFPRVPSKPADVLDDWYGFVEAAPWTTHPTLRKDFHFRPQVDSVHPDDVNYSRIYDLTEMPTLISDITAHLGALGKSHELYLPRANENPLPMTAAVIDNGVAAAVERFYAADFDRFGERWSLADLKMSPDELTMDAVRTVAYHTVANQRIGDLAAELKQAQQDLAETRKQLRAVRRRRAAANRVEKAPVRTRQIPAGSAGRRNATLTSPGWRALTDRVRRRLSRAIAAHRRTRI
jgi:hypothetical protein